MSNDVNNIPPSNNNTDAEKQTLLHALQQDLFEENENDNHNFDTDAEEGLAKLSTTKAASIVDKLNADLKQNLKKKKKKQRAIPNQQSTYITIVTILLLIIIAYIVIKKALP